MLLRRSYNRAATEGLVAKARSAGYFGRVRTRLPKSVALGLTRSNLFDSEGLYLRIGGVNPWLGAIGEGYLGAGSRRATSSQG